MLDKLENKMSINFSVHNIIYDDGNFSIAWGQWDEKMRIAVRWNDNKHNIPNTFSNPTWFQLPEYFSLIILKGILELKPSHSEEIIKVIHDLAEWDKWDKQIEKDAESGKLDFLIEEALFEKNRAY